MPVTFPGRLAELTLGAPSGLVPDLAGLRVYPMAELFRAYLAARQAPEHAAGPGSRQGARAVRVGREPHPRPAVGQ